MLYPKPQFENIAMHFIFKKNKKTDKDKRKNKLISVKYRHGDYSFVLWQVKVSTCLTRWKQGLLKELQQIMTWLFVVWNIHNKGSDWFSFSFVLVAFIFDKIKDYDILESTNKRFNDVTLNQSNY